MDNEELAKKLVEEKLHLNKLKRDNKELIDTEISKLKELINSSLSNSTKEWYIYKSIDTDSVKKIVDSIKFDLSEKSEFNINVINKTHGLNGRRDTFVVCEYKMKFDDRYLFEDKFELAIGSLVFQSKFKKLF